MHAGSCARREITSFLYKSQNVNMIRVLKFQYYILLTNIVGEIERNSTRTAVESLYSILLILIDKIVINVIYIISIQNKL